MKKDRVGNKVPLPNHQLREAREIRNLSQRELAGLIGLPEASTMGRWERGVSFPRHHYRRKLCELFDKTPEELGFTETGATSDRSEDEKPLTPGAYTHISEGIQTERALPAPLTLLIGRETEIARCCALLRRSEVRLVTILGTGGVGKTRLAIEVLRTVLHDFSGGVCFISLAAIYDAALVLPTIAKELQIQENGAETLQETLCNFLRKKSFLLVIDNFEQVLDAGVLIEQLLAACPALKVLATSRAVLHLQGEQEFTLGPLSLPGRDARPEDFLQYPSIQLFVARARARLDTLQVTPTSLATIGQICAALDGLPLAIELAVARIKLFSLPALLTELSQQRFSLLKSEVRTLPARHQTLANTIKWSYDLLTEQEQWFFRHLSVFPGGCSLAAVRMLGHRSPFRAVDVLDILVSLLDKNMLLSATQAQETPFVSMLETIREYGTSLLQQNGEWDAARWTQARYYLTLLEEAEAPLKGDQQTLWLDRLTGERENLRSALAWLIEHQETEQTLYFCEVFGKFYGLRGYWSEELHWLEAALTLSRSRPATKLQGRVLRRTGYIVYLFRDLARAGIFFAESAEISEAFDDLSNLAGALNGLGWVHRRQGNIVVAEQFFSRAVDVARTSRDNWSLANALEALSRFLYAQRNVQGAATAIEESISLARTLADRESLARQLSALVPVKIAQQQLAEAEAVALESFSLSVELGNKPLIGMALLKLADTAFEQEHYERAEELYQQFSQLVHELDDQSGMALAKLKLSQIAQKQHRLEQAVTLARESLLFFQERGDRPNSAFAARVLEDIEQDSSSM